MDSIRGYWAESSPTRPDWALDKNGTPDTRTQEVKKKESAYFEDLDLLQKLQADLRSERPAGKTNGWNNNKKERYIITITFDKKERKKEYIEKKEERILIIMKGKTQGHVFAAARRYGRERIPLRIVGQRNAPIACRDA